MTSSRAKAARHFGARQIYTEVFTVLVVSRKTGERIFIGQNQDIIITLVEIQRGKVRIGVTAPRDVPVFREEIKPELAATPPMTTARRQS